MRLAIFDGDDTLWQTEKMYDDARQLARKVVEDAGEDGAQWEALERKLDVENVKTMGFSIKRFPYSCVQAYEHMCDRTVPGWSHIAAEVNRAALSVFTAKPELLQDVVHVLVELGSAGYKLALLTKGDYPLQSKRVRESGLADLFDFVRIVDDKTSKVFNYIARHFGVAPADSWSIGNSVRSDITPALEVGMRGIWIDAHVWEYEKAKALALPEGAIAVPSIIHVLDVLRRHRQLVLRRRSL